MGQAESADNDDENCFRACMKQNKAKNKKIQALPHYGQKKAEHPYKETPTPVCDPPEKDDPQKGAIKQQPNVEELETSLQQRLYTEQAAIRKKNSLQHSTNIVTIDPREPPLVEGAANTSFEVVLGLQSKFSSTKNTCYVSPSKTAFIKTNAFCEATAPGTQCNSHQKQSGSQTRISNRTSKTATSTRSRNILMNKIEEIKQKYYERQLEIEICHDERQYQAQIDQIQQIQKTFTENSNLPEHSIGEIKAIRNKILAKLREKRQKNQQKGAQQKIAHKDEASLNVNAESPDKSVTVYDQLQLYSREGRTGFDQSLFDSQTAKKQRKQKNSLSYSGKFNKSLNTSLAQGSVDQKMEFSDYSQESLHQIRELDEQYEDYRSKMTGPSAFHKNNLKSIKPSQNNAPSNMLRQPTLSRFTKQNSACNGQPNQEPQPQSRLNSRQIQANQLPNQIKQQQESSSFHSYSSKGVEKATASSKGNKILLF